MGNNGQKIALAQSPAIVGPGSPDAKATMSPSNPPRNFHTAFTNPPIAWPSKRVKALSTRHR